MVPPKTPRASISFTISDMCPSGAGCVYSGSIRPASAAALATSMPPFTSDWNARALPEMSLADMAS